MRNLNFAKFWNPEILLKFLYFGLNFCMCHLNIPTSKYYVATLLILTYLTLEIIWLYKFTINVVVGRGALKHTGAGTGRKLLYRAYSRHSARCVSAPLARPGASSSSSHAGPTTSHILSLASWRKSSTLSDACGLACDYGLLALLEDWDPAFIIHNDQPGAGDAPEAGADEDTERHEQHEDVVGVRDLQCSYELLLGYCIQGL